MKIAMGSDHRGVGLKAELAAYLRDKGIQVVDKGPETAESCDYPDYAALVCKSVTSGEADLGIVICGSGVGVSMAANKCRGIRAALAYSKQVAELARRHNDANVLALGADFVTFDEARDRVDAWLGAEFEGGRHQRRVDKMSALEQGR